jgi:hypothetical protein
MSVPKPSPGSSQREGSKAPSIGSCSARPSPGPSQREGSSETLPRRVPKGGEQLDPATARPRGTGLQATSALKLCIFNVFDLEFTFRRLHINPFELAFFSTFAYNDVPFADRLYLEVFSVKAG